MVRLLKDETLITKWQQFFETHYKGEIETIALSYPEKRSLYVDYWAIDKYDTKLTELLINQPYKAFYNAEAALKKIDTVKGNIQIHFRPENLPEQIHRGIRDIRSADAGKLITTDGIIKKHTPVKANIIVAAFQCQKCGAVIRIEQNEDIIKEPSECFEEQGGCGRISSYKLLATLSSFIDGQKIQLQENPEMLHGCEQPQKITAFVTDDIVGILFPGDRVKITGILHAKQRKKGTFTSSVFDFVIEVISYEIKQTAYEDIEITEEDIIEIKKVSQDPEIYEKFSDSIAPTIYGMEHEKNALILQLFGGNRKIAEDGTIIRGDIHILFVGDPGTAKSQLLRYMKELAPRSILASGSGSTKAGLTATAIRDEFSEGQWVLEAGALVLANNGIACIDEFDKMHSDDRGSMHQAMEQQEISIAKAGINVTLKSQCSVLAAANPKLGRFDNFIPLYDQINLTPVLLSRFDLIFVIFDIPNREKDTELSGHILNTHMGQQVKPIFSKEFLRKYIAYAKQNIKPKLTEEAAEILQNFYVDARAANNEAIALTPRQLEAPIRLSEASAKLRLSETVTVEDAKRAIKIIYQFLSKVGVDPETGQIDIDVISTGVSHTQQDRMKTLIEIIEQTCKGSDDNHADRQEIIKEAEIKGIDTTKTEDALDHMKKLGQIFEPVKGKYRLC